MQTFKLSLLIMTALSLVSCTPPQSSSPTSKDSQTMISYETAGHTDEDHLYLEEVLGEKALSEVKSWNKRSLAELTADPRFSKMEAEALEILQSKDKIPYVSYRGGEVHNFWQDAQHVRGIWRKSTLESYLSANPTWETVLDFDALSKAEGKNWVYKGDSCLAPDYDICMVNLSDGGKDATVRREFNTRTKEFVEDGFVTEESKGSVNWLDKDTVLVSVDFGEGTMTDSGYPIVTKLWKRGTPLSDAKEIYRGTKDDVSVWSSAHVKSWSIIQRHFMNANIFGYPAKAVSCLNPLKFQCPIRQDFPPSLKVSNSPSSMMIGAGISQVI